MPSVFGSSASTTTNFTIDFGFASQAHNTAMPVTPPPPVQQDLLRLDDLLSRQRTPPNLTRNVETIWRRCCIAGCEWLFWTRVNGSRHSQRWSPCDSRPGRSPHLASPDELDLRQLRMCRDCATLRVRCSICAGHFWRHDAADIARHEHPDMRVPATRALAQRLPRFGVELELEFQHKGAPTVPFDTWISGAAADWASWAHDGSLVHGVEIRSDALTLAEHLDGRWSSLFEFAPQVFSAASDHPVGMHVHVSRDVLSVGQVGRLLSFINSPRNSAFITALAGRGANEFCVRGRYGYRARYEAKGLIHAKDCPALRADFHDLCRCQIYANRRCADRYKALNLATGQKPTIEFRLFASTTEERRFLANLQAVAALIHWSAEESWEHLGWQDYLSWLQDTPNRAYREHRLHLAQLGHEQFTMRARCPAILPAPRKVCV